MGHIAHLREQFKSINTYDYVITLMTRWKNTLFILWGLNGPSFEWNWIPFTRGCFVPIWLKLAQLFWRKSFLNFVNIFSLFRNYLPLKKGWVLHLYKHESSTPKIHCAKFGWIWPSGSGSGDEDFSNFVNVFSQFR